MEEERGFGNIIFYIILGIIAIVSSIKGKKKQQPGMPGGSAPSESGRTYFPDELFDEDEEEYAPERTDTAFSRGAEGKYEEPMAPVFANEGVSALDHMETTRRFEELLRETSTHDGFDWDKSDQGADSEAGIDINLIPEEFDARQAVIYSEIINRKEY